jgi:hypothetical protein
MAARRLKILVGLALALHASQVGGELWDGWHAPLADGYGNLRFGMDRATVAQLLSEAGYRPLNARSGTLRFAGKLDGQSVELLAEFRADARAGEGGRLCRIQLHWDGLGGPTSRALALFERWESELARRYEAPLLAEEDGANALEGGRGRFVRLHQGPEMQAILELRAVRTNRFRMLLTLDSPQLQPKLPGG